MINEERTRWAIDTLLERKEQLGRNPKKADFDRSTLCRIKAYLGPFPRALEAAGLKEIPERKRETGT